MDASDIDCTMDYQLQVLRALHPSTIDTLVKARMSDSAQCHQSQQFHFDDTDRRMTSSHLSVRNICRARNKNQDCSPSCCCLQTHSPASAQSHSLQDF